MADEKKVGHPKEDYQVEKKVTTSGSNKKEEAKEPEEKTDEE